MEENEIPLARPIHNFYYEYRPRSSSSESGDDQVEENLPMLVLPSSSNDHSRMSQN